MQNSVPSPSSSPGSEPDGVRPEENRAAAGSSAHWFLLTVLCLATLAVDQTTKQMILHTLDPASPVPVIPGLFELRLVFNSGAAFSLLEGGRFFFIAVSCAAVFFVPYYLRSLIRQGQIRFVYPVGLGLILGGAVGNALDRIFRQEGLVVDFFHLYWGRYSFPVFNVADSAITCGMTLLIVHLLFFEKSVSTARPLKESPLSEKDKDRDVAGSL